MQSELNYLQDVLGIKTFLVPEVAAEPRADFAMLFLDSSEPSVEAADLFSKILTAVKCDPDGVGFLALSLAELSENLREIESFSLVLSFDAEIGLFLQQNFPRMNVEILPSLTDMLASPAQKKIAWEKLKRIFAV